MTSYRPPTADYPLFDPSVFDTSTTALTQADGDERYVRFPVAQGAQTFPANVTMQGVSTIGNTTFTDVNPAYEIKYPVTSGRIDFYSNTSGGVSTRGCKIDATGVHTISKFDSINETSGTIDIGVNASRTGAINIGTGSSSKPISIGNTAGGTITIGRPLTAGYTGTTPDSTQIGYKADIAGLVYSTTSLPTGTANITTSAFSIPNGVWLVNVVLIANLTAGSGGYLRLSLSTSSGSIQSPRTIDFNPNTTGNNYFNYTTTIATSTATDYYLVSQTGGATASSVSLGINITRIA